MSAIAVEDLTKEYGSVRANDGVTFAVESGEVFGYLGPNGAGKTTTLRTLMGFQSPTAGTATVLGADVRDAAALRAARRRVGYLPANPAFDGDATGREILDLHGAIKGDARRSELLDRFSPPIDRPVRTYSTGNVQKLGVVQAFMHDPDVAILDEPTAGLDPLLQARFNEFVRAETAAGTTVLLSSHVLGEVRRVCDRIGILRGGRLVTVESVESLLDRSGKEVRVRARGRIDETAVAGEGVHDLAVENHETPGTGRPVTELVFTYTGEIDALVDRLAPLDLLDLDVSEAPLEDVFLRFYEESDA